MKKNKKYRSNQIPHEGDVADLKSAHFLEFFVMRGKLQCKSEIPECLDGNFYRMERCKMVVPIPKIGYKKDSKKY